MSAETSFKDASLRREKRKEKGFIKQYFRMINIFSHIQFQTVMASLRPMTSSRCEMRHSLTIAFAVADNQECSSEEPKDITDFKSDNNPKMSSGKKSRRSKVKGGSKPSLLYENVVWTRVRVVAPGQERNTGSELKYQLDLVMINFKLYKKTIVIESFRRRDSDLSTKLSFPIAAEYRGCNLEDLYHAIFRIEGINRFLTNTSSKDVINSRSCPLTIPLVTLPFRLIGFKPNVSKQISEDIDSLLQDKGLYFAMNPIYQRYDMATVRTSSSRDIAGLTFTCGERALSKSLIKELKSILMVLSSSDRPSTAYLDSIKCYLYILRCAANLCKKSANQLEGTG